MNADRRLSEVRRGLLEPGVDAFLVNLAPNVHYLTGFDEVFDDEPASLAVITPAHALLFVDSRYHEAAERAAVASGSPWRVKGPERDVWGAALSEVGEQGAVTLGLESAVEHRRFTSVSEKFAGAVVSLDGLVEEVRAVKEDHEIERIAEAARIADAAFAYIIELIRPGTTEREVALALEVFMRQEGSEGVAFPPIVAGGPNSSKPHAKPTDRPFESGDLIVLDFGARVGGYCSDMTRTVVLGAASDEQRAVYDAVRQANEAGLSSLHARVTGADADSAARSVLADLGFGERFGHGLGHGVGLEVHEAPRLGPNAGEPLPAGAVVTVEPGVYVPDFGGVRIEDLVVVTEEGHTLLTHSTKDLIEI